MRAQCCPFNTGQSAQRRCRNATRLAYAPSVSFPSLAAGSSSNIGPFSETVYLAIIAALVVWLIVYLAYKLRMTSKRDFGFPVRRRLLCLHLTVHDNQQADVPFWWTDLQVQRAVKSYWRRSLRSETEQS